MCGEDILHTGNDKVHVNCRALREEMGEGEAKRFLHDAAAKRVQKRECDVEHDAACRRLVGKTRSG